MKFRANRAELAAAAADAARAVPARPSAPVMNTLLVEATAEGDLTVTGYDFDVCIRASMGADVEQPGRVLVPARLFPAFLAGMPSGTVTVEEDGPRAVLSMPKVRYRLPLLDPYDYPALPRVPETIGTFDGSALVRAAGQVLPCARLVEGQDWSGLVQLTADPDGLSLLATDRYTVGVTKLPWLAGGPQEQVLVEMPARALTDALRGLTGEVALAVDDTGVAILGTERTTLSRRTDVRFPDISGVMAKLAPPTGRLRLRADDLADLMGRAAKVLAGGPGSVRLEVTDAAVAYSVTSETDSDMAGEIEHHGVEGAIEPLHLNAAWAADMAKAFGGEVLELGISGGLKAVQISSPALPQLHHLLQPVRPTR